MYFIFVKIIDFICKGQGGPSGPQPSAHKINFFKKYGIYNKYYFYRAIKTTLLPRATKMIFISHRL